MGYKTPYSTPQNTPLRSDVVEAATPWSEVRLEECTANQTNVPMNYGDLLRSTINGHLRSLGRSLWLAIFLVAAIWWSLSGRSYMINLPDDAEMLDTQVKIEGMQFIDASHPYIRVGILQY